MACNCNACNGCTDPIYYQVVMGDTFYAIAERFGTTTECLIYENPGVAPLNLLIGTVLRVCRNSATGGCGCGGCGCNSGCGCNNSCGGCSSCGSAVGGCSSSGSGCSSCGSAVGGCSSCGGSGCSSCGGCSGIVAY